MAKIKCVLLLLLLLLTNYTIAQSNQAETIRNDWGKIAEESTDLRQVAAYHKRKVNDLKRQSLPVEELQRQRCLNDIYAVTTASDVICKHHIEKAAKGENYFYKLANQIDPSTDCFKDAFINSINDVKKFFYIRYLSQGEERRFAMGTEHDFNKDYSHKYTPYVFRVMKDVLLNCNDELKNKYVINAVNLRGDPCNPDLVAIRSLIEEKLTDEKYKKGFTQRMNETAHLVTGQPAPNFNLCDRKGKNYSLKDFAGKFLVIDMWATWCGGCIKYIGEFSNIGKKYSNRDDVQFITISVDEKSAYTNWKYSLPRYGLMRMVSLIDYGGEQMYKNYCFTGVPRYLMIDPQGKIVSLSLPAPHNKSLENYIEEVVLNYKKQK